MSGGPIIWARRIGVFMLAALATVGAYFAQRWVQQPLDWDTLERARHMVPHIPYDHGIDVHVLYNRALSIFVQVTEVPTVLGIFSINAVAYVAFLCVLGWQARREALGPGDLVWLAIAVIAASPGLAALLMCAEDNIGYLAPVALILIFIQDPPPDRKTAVRRGLLAGGLLGVTMLLHITSLIFLALAGLAPILWRRGHRDHAITLCLMAVTTLPVYYGVHLLFFSDFQFALHHYGPIALRLEAYRGPGSPLDFADRMGHYIGGLRAMALTPSLHFMEPPAWLDALMRVWLPRGLFVLWAFIGLNSLPTKPNGWQSLTREHLVRLGVVALFAAFPFFYEPSLIERWDLLWVAGLLILIRALALGLPRHIRIALALALAVQTSGTVLTAAYFYGGAYQSVVSKRVEETIETVRKSGARVALLPHSFYLLYNAHLHYTLPGTVLIFVREADEQPEYMKIDFSFHAWPVSEELVIATIESYGKDVYVAREVAHLGLVTLD